MFDLFQLPKGIRDILLCSFLRHVFVVGIWYAERETENIDGIPRSSQS